MSTNLGAGSAGAVRVNYPVPSGFNRAKDPYGSDNVWYHDANGNYYITDPNGGYVGGNYQPTAPSSTPNKDLLGYNINSDPYGNAGNQWHDNGAGSYFIVDANNNFMGGNDAAGYGRYYAGAQPNGTVGSYQDAQSIAERATAQANYGAGLANNDRSLGDLATNFAEQLNMINKAKGKSLGSLAESMADRGLTTSGIFLKGTGDTTDRYNDQTAGQTRVHDQQYGQLQNDRTNLANILAQAMTSADTGAYSRALAAWTAKRDQAIAAAQERLKALAGG